MSHSNQRNSGSSNNVSQLRSVRTEAQSSETYCRYCKSRSHNISNCPKLARKNEQARSSTDTIPKGNQSIGLVIEQSVSNNQVNLKEKPAITHRIYYKGS